MVGVPKGKLSCCIFLSVVFLPLHLSSNLHLFALAFALSFLLFDSILITSLPFLFNFDFLLYLGSNFSTLLVLEGRASHHFDQYSHQLFKLKTTQFLPSPTLTFNPRLG